MLDIIAWSDTRKKSRITVGTAVENAIVVNVGEGGEIEVGLGLYLLQKPNDITNKNTSNCSFLTLVSANKQDFTKRELVNTELVRELHKKLGAP